jgi:hypothetical protein
MILQRFAHALDDLTALMLDAGAPLADAPPAPGITSLCAVLTRLRGVYATTPLDAQNLDGSVLFSKERLREMIALHLEATRLLRNAVALRPYAPDTDGVLTWFAGHRVRLDAADILVRLSEMEALS